MLTVLQVLESQLRAAMERAFPDAAAQALAAGTALDPQLDLLTRFNSWVDCVVERRNGYYFIKDTKMVF